MKIIYIADDGTQFDDEFECEDYEFKCKLFNLKDVTLYDENGQILKNIFDMNTYNKAERIVILSEEGYKDFISASEYCGWCEFEEIPSVGVWNHIIDPYINCHWEKDESFTL